jgi:predicted glycosyltransferase
VKPVPLRFLLYSHDGLGLGHTRRNLAIAAALTEASPESSVIIATGSSEVEELGVAPRVDVLRMPGVRKLGNGRYGSRRLPLTGREVRHIRASALKAAVESFTPAVLLADKHPLGVRGELRPALEALRAVGGRAVLGIRDILDERTAAIRDWAAEDIPAQIERHYERVLVYGAKKVLDTIEEYEFPSGVAERTRFCGYVLHPMADAAARRIDGAGRRRRPLVVGTAGGGEDGYEMLRDLITAATGAPWDTLVVYGSRCGSPESASLEAFAATSGVAARRFVPDLPHWFVAADAVVCMGGYNTLVEALAVGTPVVCVPRIRPRTEQLIRARIFAQRGLARVVEPSQLDPARLRGAVDAALAGPPRWLLAERARRKLDLGGAWNAAEQLLELAAREPVVVPA